MIDGGATIGYAWPPSPMTRPTPCARKSFPERDGSTIRRIAS